MRLLNLPRDILLYLTDFFTDGEAFPLLTVSSQFHDLFACAVWRIVDSKQFALDPVTRSVAFARYGHLVRFVKQSNFSLMHPLNWHLKLPHVVGFTFTINYKLGAEFRRRIFVGIRSLINLRRLTAFFIAEAAPYTTDGLASIIVARHRDASKRKLFEVSLFVTKNYGSSPWDACVRFCKKLEPLNIPRIRVDGFPALETPPPPVRQCHALAPYLLNLEPPIGHSAGSCASQVNGRYFNDKSLVFPLLETLNLTLCCHRTEVFDPNCVSSEKITSLKRLQIYESDTCVHSVEEFRAVCLAICARHWPNLERIMVRGMIDQADLELIFRANPQLTSFILMYRNIHMRINGGAKYSDEAMLNLDWLVHILPKLQTIHLVAPTSLHLDYDLQAVSGSIVGKYLDKVNIDGCSVSPGVLIWLLSLPKLREVSLENVMLVDPKSALKLVKRIHKKAIQSRSHQSVRLAFPDVIVSEECSKVLVEWVAAMPTLEHFSGADASLRQKIHRRCPHLKFKNC